MSEAKTFELYFHEDDPREVPLIVNADELHLLVMHGVVEVKVEPTRWGRGQMKRQLETWRTNGAV